MPVSKNTKTIAAKPKNKPIVDKLEEISSVDPIPFEGGRGFAIIQETQYLPFLEPDDNYAQLLLQARLLSTTHNACITTKKDYCAGIGFQLKDESDIKNKKFTDWCASMNLRNESDTEIRRKQFENMFTWGNVPIELVRFTVNGKKRFYVYVHSMLEWRLGKPDPNDGISKFAVQSKLFLKNNFTMNPEDWKNAKMLPIYNPRNQDKSATKYRDGYNWVRDSTGAERSLIWYKHSMSGFDNYGLPSAVSALIYQQLEYKGARHNLDNLLNNMVVSAVLALKGSLSQTELNRIGKRMVQTHTGDGKRGRVMIVGSEENIEGASLHNLDTHKEGSFKDADEAWVQKIILANQWDAILAGIVHASTLGKGTGFLTKIMEHKKTTVIQPAQLDAMEKVWKHIIKLANEWLGLGVDVENLQIKNNIDISGLTDVDITPAVLVSEVREAKGLVAVDEKRGNMMLGELSANQKRGVYVKDNGNKSNPDKPKPTNSEQNQNA